MTDETKAAAGFSPLSPPSERFWITEDMLLTGSDGACRPSFSTLVVANAFFGLSAAWLRVKMRPSEKYPHGELVLDGQPLEIRRSSAQDRQFSLLDIERVARALHTAGSINDRRLASALTMVVACAVAYRMMDPVWPLEQGADWRPAQEEAEVDADRDEQIDAFYEEVDDGGPADSVDGEVERWPGRPITPL
jgi:hypothetical protein